MKRATRWAWLAAGGAVVVTACGSDSGGGGGNDSRSGAGGAVGAGGFVGGTGGFAAGGVPGTGAVAATGGVAGTGGVAATGGAAGMAAGGSGGIAGSAGMASGGGGGAAGAAGTSTGGSGGVATGGASGMDGGAPDSSVADGGSYDGGVAGEGGMDASMDGGSGGSVSIDGGPSCSHTSAVSISLSTNSSGSAIGSVSGNTNDAIDRAEAAACDGSTAGSGGDLLYQVHLDRVRDLNVSLDAGFDAILRVYSGACDPAFELDEAGGDGCANQAGAAGTESLSYSSLPSGDYLVLVDGATSSDRGTFSLDVDAPCNGTDQLRLVEVGIGDTDYAVLRNMSDCTARTEGVMVLFDDAEGADLTVTLPRITLQPGEQLRLDENAGVSPPAGVIDVGNIQFDSDRGAAVLLCVGDCSDGDNVIDAFAYEASSKAPPALPAPVDFDYPLSGITSANKNDKAFIRVDVNGTAPSFLANDWCTGEPGAPFAFRLEEVSLGNPDYVAIQNHSDCAVGLSGYWSWFQPESDPPQHSTWGTTTLASGATYYMAENISNADVVNCCNVAEGENIAFVGTDSGYVLLCRGSCTKPRNIIDVLAFDGPLGQSFPALPGTITFSPDGASGINGSNDTTTSYYRDALTGGNTRFFQSDWKTGTASGVPQ